MTKSFSQRIIKNMIV